MSHNIRTLPRVVHDRRIAVVLNLAAKQVNDRLVEEAARVIPGEDIFISKDIESAKRIAKTVISRQYDAVLAGGGDGTFVRCVSDLRAAASRQGLRPPVVGLLRLGTGNGLADALGLPTGQTLEEMVDHARVAPTKPLELLHVAGQLTPFAGVGLDADILRDYREVGGLLEKARLPLLSGPARYALAVSLRTLPRMLRQPSGKCADIVAVNMGSPAYRVGADGQTMGKPVAAGDVLYEGPVTLAAGSTIPYYGLGLKMFPFAQHMPKRFSLRIATCSPAEVIANLPALFKGTYKSDTISDFLCDRVVLYFKQPTNVQVGGDLIGPRPSLPMGLSPESVEVLA